MARTIKAVRRANGCICKRTPELYENEVQGVCRYGYCAEFRCPVCRGMLGGWGPMGCKCDNGPRWVRHPEMASMGRYDLEKDVYILVSVAIKPSIRKRQRGRRN